MLSRRSVIALPLVFGIAGITPARTYAKPRSALGGMIISGFRGTEVTDPEVDQVRRYIENGVVAGVILLKRNIKSPDQLRKLTASIRDASPDLSPIISIDQEGGKVARLEQADGFLPWMSASDLAHSNFDEAEIESYYAKRAAEMASLGINLNFGPVVDLNVNPRNPIIGAIGRSYGATAELVSGYASAFVQAHRKAGVMTCLKHFPGHGSSNTDSHEDAVDVSGTWSDQELQPYQSLIDAGSADSVMNAHLSLEGFSDAPGRPTSLSRKALQAIRQKLGFAGPVITDDMQMGAIANHFRLEDAAIAAVNAGNTLLIYSNYRKSDRIDTAERVLSALENAEADDWLDMKTARAQVELATRFRQAMI